MNIACQTTSAPSLNGKMCPQDTQSASLKTPSSLMPLLQDLLSSETASEKEDRMLLEASQEGSALQLAYRLLLPRLVYTVEKWNCHLNSASCGKKDGAASSSSGGGSSSSSSSSSSSGRNKDGHLVIGSNDNGLMIRKHCSVGSSSDDKVQCPLTNAEKTGSRRENDQTSCTSIEGKDDEGHGVEQGGAEGQINMQRGGAGQVGMQVEGEGDGISIEVGNDTKSAVLFYIHLNAPNGLAPALGDPSVTVRWRARTSQTDPLTLMQCEPENEERAKMFYQLLHTEVTRGNRR